MILYCCHPLSSGKIQRLHVTPQDTGDMAASTKVLVIGAGWSGLAAAKTYLQISRLLNRPIDLTVLDDSNNPGGVWSTSRLYPGLIANSPAGLYEFSDMTMVNDDSLPWWSVLPGEQVQAYLEAYARRFEIYPKIRFDSKVVKAQRRYAQYGPSGWIVETEKGDLFECDKLILACGLFSKPRIPKIPKSSFKGISIHHRELGSRHQELRNDPSIRNIVVVGGCKSSVEACNIFLPSMNPNKSHRISWIVRPSESGVPLIVEDVDKPFNAVAVNNMRAFGAISPSLYDTNGIMYRFFHSGKSVIGNFILSSIWNITGWSLQRKARLNSSANGRRLKSEGGSMFYDVNIISLVPTKSPLLEYLHADDDAILKVHRATPVALQEREMVLVSSDGSTSTVPCDAVIWCTGSLPTIDFFDDAETRNLGLPVMLHNDTLPNQSPDQSPDPSSTSTSNSPSTPTASNSAIAEAATPRPALTYICPTTPSSRAAEEEILSLFAILRTPARPAYPPPSTPYRLYRQCIPLSSFPDPSNDGSREYDRTITLPFATSTSQTATTSELLALYSVAFMEGLLPFPAQTSPSSSPPQPSHSLTPLSSFPTTRAEAEKSVEKALAFQRRRYGVKGARDPEIVLEVQSFLDQLCRDLGVEVYRKRLQEQLINYPTYSSNEDKVAASTASWASIPERMFRWMTNWYCGVKGYVRGNVREYWTPYYASDYKGVVEEFLARNGYLSANYLLESREN
jgi:dimethylaniline monooxygenase (N-oxide forming)